MPVDKIQFRNSVKLLYGLSSLMRPFGIFMTLVVDESMNRVLRSDSADQITFMIKYAI